MTKQLSEHPARKLTLAIAERAGIPSMLAVHYAALWRQARKAADKRKIPWEIDLDAYCRIIARSPYKCSLSGIAWVFSPKPGQRNRPFAPSLDRIDSNLPYTEDNCRFVVAIANYAMNEWGFEPLKRLATAIMLRDTRATEAVIKRTRAAAKSREKARLGRARITTRSNQLNGQ
jgi:hypothetical protein